MSRLSLALACYLALLVLGCGGGKTPTDDELANRNAALIEAAWSNDVATAQDLIDAGADVNHKDSTSQSAYLISTSEGHLELLELTLDNGADVTSLDSFDGTGLIRAAERGHADVVERLLQTDIDVNHVNNLGWTALHEAILLGDGSDRYVRTVRLLIDPRRRPRATDRKRRPSTARARGGHGTTRDRCASSRSALTRKAAQRLPGRRDPTDLPREAFSRGLFDVASRIRSFVIGSGALVVELRGTDRVRSRP